MNHSQNPIALRSQRELIDALLSLMKEMPFSEITIKQILIEAKLSKKTFYRNFDNKMDLLNAYLDILLQNYKKRILVNNEFVFTSILKVIAEFVLENKDELQLFWKNNLEYLILMKLNEFIQKFHHTLCPEPSRFENSIVMLNNGAIWNVLNEWMRTGMTEPLDEILAFLETYLCNIGTFLFTAQCQ